MKELIHTIIKDNELMLTENIFQELYTTFAYYTKQDDFFIFIFTTYTELNKKLNVEKGNDIEYALNSYVVRYKDQFLQEYKERSIDYNLSLILILEEDVDIPALDFIEENAFNSKKYILKYSEIELEVLKKKIIEKETIESNLINLLNTLITENSNLLKTTENESLWYDLLLSFFIKIPFLNYKEQDNHKTKELENLEEVILSKLDDEKKQILNKILSTSDNVDVDDLISEITKIISKDE